MVTVSLFVRLEAKPGKEEELTASSGRGQNARAGETYTSYEHAARGKSKCCQCDGGLVRRRSNRPLRSVPVLDQRS